MGIWRIPAKIGMTAKYDHLDCNATDDGAAAQVGNVVDAPDFRGAGVPCVALRGGAGYNNTRN